MVSSKATVVMIIMDAICLWRATLRNMIEGVQDSLSEIISSVALCNKWIPLGCHSPITTTQEQAMTLLTQREGMDAFFPDFMPLPRAEPVNQSGVQESQGVMKWEITVILNHAHKFLDNPPFREWSWIPLSLTKVVSRLFPINRTKLALQSLMVLISKPAL